MNAIKKLSGKDLTKLIDEAAKELNQRKRMDALSKDIQRVIAKHKVSKTELASLIDMIRSETKVSKKRRRVLLQRCLRSSKTRMVKRLGRAVVGRRIGFQGFVKQLG